MKYQKLTTNYWHLLKGKFFCTCVLKITIKTGLILESKGKHSNLQKKGQKRAKYLKIWAKMFKI